MARVCDVRESENDRGPLKSMARDEGVVAHPGLKVGLEP